jgi:PhnB protein
MPTILNPYLSFKDNARDAMTFYEAVFGGKLTISTFKEYQLSQDPSEDNHVMHAMLVTPNGLTLMAADTPSHMGNQASPNGSISLSGDDEAELTAYYEKLSSGGTILEPLRKAPWGDSFGMFSDKFGINWMVNIAGKRS